MSELPQPRETATERWRERVVGIVVKALVLPERVHLRRNVLRFCAQAAERGDVFVSDLESRQRFGKDVAIVLRIGARARDGADIYHASDLRSLEQVDELLHRAR